MNTVEKILVVDDVPTIRNFVGRVLREKYDVVFASNGREALNKMAPGEQPDLILLDVVMPDLSGYEVCRLLKSNPETAHIPVIFLSGQNELDDKLKGFDIGGVDYITKPFNTTELLARVGTHIQLARVTRQLREAHRELAEKHQRMEQELRTAAEIQSHLLPDATPPVSGLEFAWEFLPSATLGGDIFNIMYLDKHHLGMYIIDVSGHGVPSALVTFAIAQSLNPQGGIVLSDQGNGLGSAPTVVPPAQVLAELDLMYPVERFDKTFTIVYLVLNLETGDLTYANAGHPPGLLIKENGRIQRLETGGSIIGLGGLVPFEQERIRLAEGDRLLLYTDGLLEFQNSEDMMFGEDRLEKVIRNTRTLPVSSVIYALSWSLLEFGGSIPPQDDITILAMACCERCFRDKNGWEVMDGTRLKNH